MVYRIGTRGSKLAMWQAEYVQQRLRQEYPQDTFELVVIQTTGDRITDRPLHEIGQNGVFVRQIERELFEGTIDLAVHSMKDLPAELPEGLVLAPAWGREVELDALVLRKAASLAALPQGAVIGTGSKRRACQLLALRPDLQITGIRGNVDTRLRLMEEQQLDGIVLAAAGLHRLGLQDRITEYLSVEQMIPAPTQGILAIELREDRTELLERLSVFRDEEAQTKMEAERTFLKTLGADCHMPVGANLSRMTGDSKWVFRAMFGTEDGSKTQQICLTGNHPKEMAVRAARLLREQLSGTVYLVGAGPGDPELITVRGRELLQKADCVVYDRLVSPKLLQLCRDDCEKMYVGKENHRHTLPQEEIQALLAEKALSSDVVVRLKGGDPFVFGRGGEEMLYLRDRGIRCEEVPGISSAIAALAYAGIPITHRGLATGFHVVTAHSRRDTLADIDFEAMARGNDTCVFLMGLESLGQIAQGLIGAGMDPQMPAAVISHGTMPDQEVCVSRLGKIAEAVAERKISSPALIVVGRVVELSVALGNHRQAKVSGKRCLVAEVDSPDAHWPGRKKKKKTLRQHLEEAGAQTDMVCTGRIQVVRRELTREMVQADWILFTGKNGVHGFFENLFASGMDLRAVAASRFACIGAATAEVLSGYGIYADYTAEQSTGKFFFSSLCRMVSAEQKVLYPRNRIEEDDPQLAELRTCCKLSELAVYENLPVPDAKELSDTELLQYDAIFITNAWSARRLLEGRSQELLRELSRDKRIYAIGPATKAGLAEVGITECRVAPHAGYEALAGML